MVQMSLMELVPLVVGCRLALTPLNQNHVFYYFAVLLTMVNRPGRTFILHVRYMQPRPLMDQKHWRFMHSPAEVLFALRGRGVVVV